MVLLIFILIVIAFYFYDKYDKRRTEENNAIEEDRKRQETLDMFHTLDDLLSLTPVQFERLIQLLFQSMGYVATMTKASGDHGIDIRLHKNDVLELVQCKRYTGNVSVKTIREFFGVMVDHRVSKGYVVTTGNFTFPAQQFASGKGIHLIDGAELVGMLMSRKIGVANSSE